EPKRADDEEGHAPADELFDSADHQWAKDSAHRRATVEDGHADGAFALREPLGDDLGCAGPVAGLAEAEDEAAGGEAGESGDERVRHGGQAPDHDGDGEAGARAVLVIETAGDGL